MALSQQIIPKEYQCLQRFHRDCLSWVDSDLYGHKYFTDIPLSLTIRGFWLISFGSVG